MPIDDLRTLDDVYRDDFEPDPELDSEIPAGADRIVVLSQRYLDCTVLDYRQPGPPRAGLVDFDRHEPEVWFDSFEELFGALRRARLPDPPGSGGS